MKKNELLMISGTDYKEMTKELLEEADLIGRIRDRNWLIGIKPNLVSASEASWGATTHPEIVAGILEYLRERGCRNLVMLEGSWVGGRTEEAIQVCGYDRLAQEYQTEFWDMQKDRGAVRDCGGMELSVCERVKHLDFLINVPVLKGHCQTKITCALKNMKGLIPNREKRRFHSLGLHKPIAHLNAGIHQDFIVVDNICGDLDFEDGGNPVVMNRILAAADPVLCDAFVCRMLDYKVDDVPYVRMAEALGVGCADLSQAVIREVRRRAGGECGQCKESGAGFFASEIQHRERKIVALEDAVEEVDSCSACYGYLIPALEQLRLEGLLEKLDTKICIGQGYQGQNGKLGIGNCTRGFACSLKGCPPTEKEIYDFLKKYIRESEGGAAG
ncbi:MAG: DUF362 domain-containing protein [Candidatus Limivivens sp.]|nr:DUF362 domain-containing protein [Candidatus Limivivens sp.]